MIKQAVIGNMWWISTDQIGSSTADMSLGFTPVLNLLSWPQSSRIFHLWFLWSQCGPCQGHVYETGISWSFTWFHFNKLAPNYPSIVVHVLTDVFGQITRSLFGLTRRGHVSLSGYTYISNPEHDTKHENTGKHIALIPWDIH